MKLFCGICKVIILENLIEMCETESHPYKYYVSSSFNDIKCTLVSRVQIINKILLRNRMLFVKQIQVKVKYLPPKCNVVEVQSGTKLKYPGIAQLPQNFLYCKSSTWVNVLRFYQ